MKKLFLIVAVLLVIVVAAVVAPLLLEDPGHVRIDIGGWRVEMSVLVLFGLALAFWLALSLTIALIRMPGAAWRKARSARTQRQLEKGLLALAEGDWQQAETSLRRALIDYRSPIGYLAAARAAQGQAESERRDSWLKLADARFGRRHRVVGLTKARMLMDEGRASEAIPILEALHLRKARHAGVLRLLLQAYQDAGRWRDLRLLTPSLVKAGIVDADSAAELDQLAAVRELEAAVEVEQLESVWRVLPRRLRKARQVVLAHARRASELGRHGLAGAELRRLLEQQPDREALKLYAYTENGERTARIADCRRWLDRDPGHEGLHLALGMLYAAERDDERAREHLEQALAARPDGEAFALLGRVLDRSGQLEAAAHCYRNALRLKAGRAAEPLPALSPPQQEPTGRGNSPDSE